MEQTASRRIRDDVRHAIRRFAGLALALVAMLLAAGCGEQIPMRGDVTFTAEEREDIEAANVWLSERMRRTPVDIVWDLEHPTSPELAPEFSITREPLRPGLLGAVNGTRIVIHPGSPRGKLRQVFAHELAHYFGLDHHTEAGLMGAHEEDEPVWTEADEAECNRVSACGEPRPSTKGGVVQLPPEPVN